MKNCPECGNIILGRIDKKFCSDMCRNNYNNKLKAVDVNYVRNINNILKKNRRILEEICPEEKQKIKGKSYEYQPKKEGITQIT